jgi:N-acetylneuraminate synthase/sialic acid synthase
MSKKLVAGRELAAGTILSEADIAIKSPGDGLKPFMIETIVGRRLIRNLDVDDNLRLEDTTIVEQPVRSGTD